MAYTVTLRGTVDAANVRAAKARLYVDGAQAAEVVVTPGAPFDFVFSYPTADSDIPVEHSYLNSVGLESARVSQSIAIPAAPDAPTGPLTFLSVVAQ